VPGYFRGLIAVIVAFSVMAVAPASMVVAAPIGDPAFQRTWARTDEPVAAQRVTRTWMWGPEPISPMLEEPYVEGPGGMRMVQYFDKTRMEITDPGADPNSIWFVTNGLLVVEMMTGRMQVGHETFRDREPAMVNVAGDLDDPDGPTFATLSGLRLAPALANGSTVVQRVSRDGTVSEDGGLAAYGVTVGNYVEETGHTVAGPFWSFMTSSGLVNERGSYVQAPLFVNPFYATGLPITEPYWATVRVGGTPLEVLLQCFERRCLTFTPSNPAEWQVEAGNVGLQYYQWRYGEAGGEVPVPAPELPPLPALDTPPPGAPSPEAYFNTLPPGAALPSDGECAERVRRYDWEPRPNNRLANFTTGTGIASISGANDAGQAALTWRVNGNFTGWTDEIIQWGACKWGIDEDTVRAIAVWQSWWHQWFTSNDGESHGLMSVNAFHHPGTHPVASNSTAFNVDYALAWHRACYEGYFDWVGADTRGDLWGCVGLWRSGGWYDGTAANYIQEIQLIRDTRNWLQDYFWQEHNPQ
jgi:hypothetical protein